MKKNSYKILIFVFVLTFLLGGCKEKNIIESKYTYNFFGTFDTIVQTVQYEESEEKADEINNYIEKRFHELHKQFDKYNNYEGINNIKTINDNAGKSPVKVSDELFNLIKTSIEYYDKYSNDADISFGAVLNVWSKYRDLNENLTDDDEYKIEERLPSMEELKAADQYTGIENILLDDENKTVFIKNKNTVIDVGATAKGYAVELVCDELEEKGCDSFMISAGGNVKAVGKPHDGIRDRWGVGIRNPDVMIMEETDSNIIEAVFINKDSVVTSGDYERFFTVDGKNYCHLIDKDTLMPGDYFRSVTVIYEDSGFADFLSTTLFLMPFEEGKNLVEKIDGAECIWIMPDGNIEFTDGAKKIMRSQGASGADK